MKWLGFPISSLDKVLNRLEKSNINYKIFEYTNGLINLKIDCNFKEDNRYYDIFEISKRYIKNRNKINKISEMLLKNIENEKIEDTLNLLEKNVKDNLINIKKC